MRQKRVVVVENGLWERISSQIAATTETNATNKTIADLSLT